MAIKSDHFRSLRVAGAISVACLATWGAADASDPVASRSAPPLRTDAELIWARGGPDAMDGAVLYQAHCSSCHKTDGKGSRAMYPPLATSDYFAGNPRRLLSAVMEGVSGPITVNGARYDQIMPTISYLDDAEIASVLTYVLNSFGNEGGEITTGEVAAYRKAAGIGPALTPGNYHDADR